MRCPTYGSRAGAPRAQNRRQAPIKWASELRLRCSFRRVVWKSSEQVWAQLHEQAFRYFGGVPSYVVLDNLKEGVLKLDS